MRVLLLTRNKAADQVPTTSLTQLEPVQNSNYNEYSLPDTTRYLTNLLKFFYFTVKKNFISNFDYDLSILNLNTNTEVRFY